MSDERGRPLDVWLLVGVGGYNVACLLAGFGLGWVADSRLGTTPALTLLGLLAGIGSGVVGSWLRIRTFLRD